jgi:hypothetical protein
MAILDVTFRQSLIMQTVWLATAALYNGISITLTFYNYPPLKEGKPVETLLFLALYGVIILIGHAKLYRLYISLGYLLTIILIVAGIGSHIYNALSIGISEVYNSFVAWALAILINIYGVTAFLLGISIAKNENRRKNDPFTYLQ